MQRQDQTRRTQHFDFIRVGAMAFAVAFVAAACSGSGTPSPAASSPAATTTTSSGGSTTSTTSGGDATCPGGPECYQTSISPSSGGYGAVITVNIVEGGCGDEAFLVPPGGGAPIASTGSMDPGAGSLHGTITVPNEIPAPETYAVTTNKGPQDKCSKSFEVTAG